MKKVLIFLVAAALAGRVYSQALLKPENGLPYRDLHHFSQTFGKDKYYRLYLPAGYEQSEMSYPVVYFFHGWGGRHFKDPSANLEYEMIGALVNKYRAILVMWDGNYDENDPRPYNMGYHDNVVSKVQMKDYFPELIAHIDSTYRTLNDRSHRGIIGFSMGGMMSWFMAGKYPDKICAAVNMTGSPEFFIGYPDNHTLFPLRYLFKNLQGIKIRMHNSTNGELVYLNEEVNRGAHWEGAAGYSYQQFRGGHMVDDPGSTEIFETALKFVVEAFDDPLPKPERWWHYDLYPDFQIWGYNVNSTKNRPGFILLKNVSKNGLGIGSLRWLPDGPPMEGLKATITTAPLYKPGSPYQIITCSRRDGKLNTTVRKSDSAGRIQMEVEGETEAGIYTAGDAPDFVVMDYGLDGGRRYLRPGQENNLTLKILNRGGDLLSPRRLEVELIPPAGSEVNILNSRNAVVPPKRARIIEIPAFRVRTARTPPDHGEPPWIKFKVLTRLGHRAYADEVVVPVLYDAALLDTFRIDDGRMIRGEVFGDGNGDGDVSAGESIMLYVADHRTRLYSDDPYVERDHEQVIDEVIPSTWPDGYTLSSVCKISDQCPDGHVIEFLVSYETKRFMPIERNVTWRKVYIPVHNKH